MIPETVCEAPPNLDGLLIFFLCIVIFFFGMIIAGLIFNRIDRVQDEAAEKYARRMKEELRK